MESSPDPTVDATQQTKSAPAIAVVDLTDDGEGSASAADPQLEDSDDSDENYETESFYEDLADAVQGQVGVDDDNGVPEAGLCTPEEISNYKRLLRTVGIDQFVIRTIEAGVSAKKLCSAFFTPPSGLFEGLPDSAWYPLLGKLIEREFYHREKLPKYNSIDDAAALLKKSSNVVIITGAGISTSLGIPDFRSKHTGFYAQLAPLGLSDPQEVFDLDLFTQDPSLFYSIAKGILPSTKKFSPTHAFIRLLQDKDKLLTNYTQNIDNLEEAAGIDADKLMQCHGSFANATCMSCRTQVRGEAIFDDLKAGKVARCQACVKRIAQMPKPAGMKRKRSWNELGSKKKRDDFEDSSDESDEFTIEEPGVMKPDIIFFGEALSQDFHDRFKRQDRAKVDLVIVLGTKLTVAPVGDIPGSLPPHVPQIFVSREPCKHIQFDIELLGDCDVVVEELCKRAGWDLKHEMIPDNQNITVSQLADDEGTLSKYQWVLKTDAQVEASKQAPNPTAGDAHEGAVEHGLVNEEVAKNGLYGETSVKSDRRSRLVIGKGKELEGRSNGSEDALKGVPVDDDA